MRIGIFLKLLKPESGGGFTYQDEIVRALGSIEQHKHQFVLLCQGSGYIPVEQSSSIEIVRLGSNFLRRLLTEFAVTHVGQDLQMLLNTKFAMVSSKMLRRYRVDCVWFPTGSLFGQLDVPYFATVWDSQHRLQPWFPEVSTGGEWLLRERHYELLLKQAAYVIVGNNAGKEEVQRFYGIPPERIRFFPHPTPKFALDVASKNVKAITTRFSLRDPYVLYPAQFWPHKNHQLLVKALQHLKETNNVRIGAALTGSDKGNKEYIKNLAHKCGVADQISFLDFVSRDELVYLYQHAFALVIPTFFGPETFPPLEAFALGCPVIASNVAGAREQLGDSALFFEPTDALGLANQIKVLHSNKTLRTRLINRGLKRAKQWTSGDYALKLISLFDEFETIRSCWPSSTK